MLTNKKYELEEEDNDNIEPEEEVGQPKEEVGEEEDIAEEDRRRRATNHTVREGESGC